MFTCLITNTRSWKLAFLLFALVITPQLAFAIDAVNRALLIGINDYERVPPLQGSLNDVDTMAEILVKRFGFERQNIRILTDKQATRAGIFQAFIELAEQTNPDDRIYIHYSGHGSQVADNNGDEADGMDETILPQDARMPGIPDITDDELDQLISKLKTDSIVVVLDSCHSGTGLRGITPDIRPRFVPPDTRKELYAPTTTRGLNKRAVVPLSQPKKFLLFTGAAADQSALDGPFGSGRYHGLFTFSFSKSISSMSPDASPLQIMQEIGNQFEKVRPLLGSLPLPEPQLEGTKSYIDHPLLSLLSSSRSESTVTTAPTRLPWAQVRLEKGGIARILESVDLGAQPGSIWAVYPQDETGFVPGKALARLVVETIVGKDARAKILDPNAPITSDSRAILIAPPILLSRMQVFLRNMDESLRRSLQRGLSKYLGNSLGFVNNDQKADFIIDCNQGDENSPANCAILSAQGIAQISKIVSNTEELPSRIFNVLARPLLVSYLMSLENSGSEMRLIIDVHDSVSKSVQTTTNRGLIVNADFSPERLHFYKIGTPRTSKNSLQLELRSSHDCYLTLVDVDPEGNVQQIFPTSLQNEGFYPQGWIEKGNAVLIPDSLQKGNRAGFHFDYGPPAGLDSIRAFCMTNLKDARKLRDRIARLTTPDTPRAVSNLRSAFLELGRDLSEGTTRGVRVVADEPAQDISANSSSTMSDWTASSITLEVGE